MINKFYRPEGIKISEFYAIVSDLETSFDELITGSYALDKCETFIEKLLKDQDEDGFWGLLDPNEAPCDARVEFYYTPTYYASAFLMKFFLDNPVKAKTINGFENGLSEGLKASTGRQLLGHGYDGITDEIKALGIFCNSDVAKFINMYPELCPEFTNLIHQKIARYKKDIATSSTIGAWGEDYLPGYKDVLKHFEKDDNEMQVFVYGTLLKGLSNHNSYLSEAKFYSEAVLSDYALYDLGAFPGIKMSIGDKVKGEIYTINPEILGRLNILEGEGSLYILKTVEVIAPDDTKVSVYTYEYNHGVNTDNKVPFYNQPWGNTEKIDVENHVWYASYGSNLLIERFLSYIKGGICRYNGKNYISCSDQALPLDLRPITIPYKLYFGNESSSWGSGGVAFLDTNQPGETLGRMYLITKEQFEHVHMQEGNHSNWYNEIVTLGDYEGIAIKTITNSSLRPKARPNESYNKVLVEGIKETYPDMNFEDTEKYIEHHLQLKV